MFCTPFRVSLIVIGIFALGFQIAGVLVKAWIRVGLEVTVNASVQDQSVNIGLWSVDVCEGLRGVFDEECVERPIDADLYWDVGLMGNILVIYVIM